VDANTSQNHREKPQVAEAPEAECEAVGAQTPPSDPDLARLVEAWPTLPAALKAGIVAMVGAAVVSGAR